MYHFSMEYLHEGHRERLRNKLRRFGLSGLEDHEKLEYLLFPFVPRRDTNPIAHELIDTFGSFKRVLDADVEDLIRVKGISENAALFLHLLPQILTAYETSEGKRKFASSQDVVAYCQGKIGREETEHLLILFLSECGTLIKEFNYTSEKTNAIYFDRLKIAQKALQCHADTVVLAHNHPSGFVAPSQEDVAYTNQVVRALGAVNIHLWNHYIVTARDVYDMGSENKIEPCEFEESIGKRRLKKSVADPES